MERDKSHRFEATPMEKVKDREQLQRNIEITLALPNGLGFGEGSINAEEIANEAGPAVMRLAEEAVTHKDRKILVEVSRDKDGNMIEDDGCGDGRDVGLVFRFINGTKEFFKKSLNRAKVFGAGITMGTAGRIGVEGPSQDDLIQEFAATGKDFNNLGIDFGGHTAEHTHGESCGCGAIDLAPQIIANTVKYSQQISDAIDFLGVPTDNLPDVLANFNKAHMKFQDTEYSGVKVMSGIQKMSKFVKELVGGHKEAFVMLNFVEGMTVNQKLVRDITGKKVQIFAVDVWRLKQIAEKQYPDEPHNQINAFLGELVYTLATAATLTAGNLPVFTAKEV